MQMRRNSKYKDLINVSAPLFLRPASVLWLREMTAEGGRERRRKREREGGGMSDYRADLRLFIVHPLSAVQLSLCEVLLYILLQVKYGKKGMQPQVL